MSLIFFKSRTGIHYSYNAKDNEIRVYTHPTDNNITTKNEHIFHFYRPTSNQLQENKSDFLILNITEQCNMRCSYCAYSGAYEFERKHSTTIMSKETAKRAINFFLSRQGRLPRRIGLYGGEPLTAWPLVKEVIDYSLNIDPLITFTLNTNLLKIENDVIDYLASRKVLLLVSLDGNKTMHDKNRVDRHKQGTFERINANLNKIYRRYPNYYRENIVFLCTLSDPYKLNELSNFYESSEIYKQPWNVTTVMPFDNSLKIDALFSSQNNYLQEINLLIDAFIDKAIEGNAREHFGHWIFGRKLKQLHYRELGTPDLLYINNCCLPGQNKLFVSSDGRYFPCERCGNFMELGNVETGLTTDLNTLVEKYKNNCEQRCGNCANVRFCDLCYLSARKGNQLDFSRKNIFCSNKLFILQKTLYIYIQAYLSIMLRLSIILNTSFNVLITFQIYKIRWQIELLFKDLKSGSNLTGVNTGVENIVYVMLFVSLASHFLKQLAASAIAVTSGGETSLYHHRRSPRYMLTCTEALFLKHPRYFYWRLKVYYMHFVVISYRLPF